MGGCSKFKALIAGVVLFLSIQQADAFVLIGPMLPAETTGGGVNFNITDDLGGPKELKRFFRWNMPYLTYSFDLSFVQYFGIEGMGGGRGLPGGERLLYLGGWELFGGQLDGLCAGWFPEQLQHRVGEHHGAE